MKKVLMLSMTSLLVLLALGCSSTSETGALEDNSVSQRNEQIKALEEELARNTAQRREWEEQLAILEQRIRRTLKLHYGDLVMDHMKEVWSANYGSCVGERYCLRSLGHCLDDQSALVPVGRDLPHPGFCTYGYTDEEGENYDIGKNLNDFLQDDGRISLEICIEGTFLKKQMRGSKDMEAQKECVYAVEDYPEYLAKLKQLRSDAVINAEIESLGRIGPLNE